MKFPGWEIREDRGTRCVFVQGEDEPVAYESRGEWVPTAYGVSYGGPRVEIWGPATEERVRELVESGEGFYDDSKYLGGPSDPIKAFLEAYGRVLERDAGVMEREPKGKTRSRVTGHWH